jgi:cbb3-type cytochrome oxidase maturation protein
MSAFFILIGISILVALGFLIAFLFSVKAGQYDDDYTPSIRMLFDNTNNTSTNKKTNK